MVTPPTTAKPIDEFEAKLNLDPSILAAKRDVDRSLIAWALGLSPLERLDVCQRMASELMRLRDAASENR